MSLHRPDIVKIFAKDSANGEYLPVKFNSNKVVAKSAFEDIANQDYEFGLESLNMDLQLKDLNSVFHYINTLVAYLYERGVAEFSPYQDYPAGSVVSYDGKVWLTATAQEAQLKEANDKSCADLCASLKACVEGGTACVEVKYPSTDTGWCYLVDSCEYHAKIAELEAKGDALQAATKSLRGVKSMVIDYSTDGVRQFHVTLSEGTEITIPMSEWGKATKNSTTVTIKNADNSSITFEQGNKLTHDAANKEVTFVSPSGVTVTVPTSDKIEEIADNMFNYTITKDGNGKYGIRAQEGAKIDDAGYVIVNYGKGLTLENNKLTLKLGGNLQFKPGGSIDTTLDLQDLRDDLDNLVNQDLTTDQELATALAGIKHTKVVAGDKVTVTSEVIDGQTVYTVNGQGVCLSPDAGNLLEYRNDGNCLYYGIEAEISEVYADSLLGNDNNPGTQESPFKTIDRAVSVFASSKKARIKLKAGDDRPDYVFNERHLREQGTVISPYGDPYIDGALVQPYPYNYMYVNDVQRPRIKGGFIDTQKGIVVGGIEQIGGTLKLHCLKQNVTETASSSMLTNWVYSATSQGNLETIGCIIDNNISSDIPSNLRPTFLGCWASSKNNWSSINDVITKTDENRVAMFLGQLNIIEGVGLGEASPYTAVTPNNMQLSNGHTNGLVSGLVFHPSGVCTSCTSNVLLNQ